MGSIQLDGVLISIGLTFRCPKCREIKKTNEFLTRNGVQTGIFKSSDIICNTCFDQQTNEIRSVEKAENEMLNLK